MRKREKLFARTPTNVGGRRSHSLLQRLRYMSEDEAILFEKWLIPTRCSSKKAIHFNEREGNYFEVLDNKNKKAPFEKKGL